MNILTSNLDQTLLDSFGDFLDEDLKRLADILEAAPTDDDGSPYFGTTPISNYQTQPKKKTTPRRPEHASREHYDFEQTQTQKMWDSNEANNFEPGTPFAFIHKARNLAEIYLITEVIDLKWRRRDWEIVNRNPILFDQSFYFHLPFNTLKLWWGPYKEKYRISGTKRNKLRADLVFHIRYELARRAGTTYKEARIWNLRNRPIDPEIYSIVRNVAKIANDEFGKPKFFDNQIENAAINLQILLDRESYKRGIAGADLQSGKSGSTELTALSVHKVFLKKGIINEKDNVGVIFLLHVSDSALKDQTKDRLCGGHATFDAWPGSDLLKSTIDPKIYGAVEMLSGGAEERVEALLAQFKERGCSKIIILCDEAQVAINSDQQIGRILKTNGVTSFHLNEDVYILGVTATPSRFYGETSDGHPLTVYWGKHGDSYYGIEDMVKNGKVHHAAGSESLTSEMIENHIGSYIRHDTYILARASMGQKKAGSIDIWDDWANKRGIEVIRLDCGKGNINELSQWLKNPPSFYDKGPNVLIVVKMAARAGLTLPIAKHVSVAFDTFKGRDAIIQSFLGRFCGNQPGRKEDCPDIFTDMTITDAYLKDRAVLMNGQMPDNPMTQSKKVRRTKVEEKWKIKCVSTNSPEYKSWEQNREIINSRRDNIDENRRKNLAKKVITGGWNNSDRALGLKNKKAPFGRFDSDVKILIEQYPDLTREDSEFVLIAINELVKLKPGNSALQQR